METLSCVTCAGLADTITVEPHPLIKRAKDIGSAAVMLTLFGAALTWIVLLWPVA